MLATEASLAEQGERTRLAEKVYFIDSEALAQQFPELSPKQREREITRQHGSVFIMGIGGQLKEVNRMMSGRWTTMTGAHCQRKALPV